MAVVAQEETGNFDFSVKEIVSYGPVSLQKKPFDTDTAQDREIARESHYRGPVCWDWKTGILSHFREGKKTNGFLIARALAQQAKTDHTGRADKPSGYRI